MKEYKESYDGNYEPRQEAEFKCYKCGKKEHFEYDTKIDYCGCKEAQAWVYNIKYICNECKKSGNGKAT